MANKAIEIPTLEIDGKRLIVPSMLRRTLAHMADFLAAAAVAGFIFWVLPIESPIQDLGGDGFWGTVVPLLLYYLIIALYRPVAHAAAGSTIGKAMFQMRLVGYGAGCSRGRLGRKPSFSLALARWAVFYIMPLGPLISLFVALGSRHNRGFHDMVAGTAVVSTLALPSEKMPEPEEDQ